MVTRTRILRIDTDAYWGHGTVFQTVFLTACYNPETASRVTLASLGTVFQTALSVLSRLRLSRHVQNLSRITLMRRICSFHGSFSFGFVCACRVLGSSRIYLSLWTICGLLLLIGNPAPYRRKYNPKEIQDQVNPKIKRNPWKDKIRRIRVIRELFWACAHRAEGEGAIY